MSQKPDTNTLLEQCRNGDSTARIQAMFELEEANVKEAIPTVLHLLATGDEDVRETAAHVLGQLGDEHDEQIGSALQARLTDPSIGIRNQAAEALSLLRYAPAREVLEHVLLHDPDWVVRCSAAEALGNLGDRRALPALETALNDEPYPVRNYAAFSIGQLGDKDRLPVIRQRLALEDHPTTRAELAVVALQLGDEGAFDELLTIIGTLEDKEFATNVLGSVNDFLSAPLPAPVTARAAELGNALVEIDRRLALEGYPLQLRERLVELARAAASDTP